MRSNLAVPHAGGGEGLYIAPRHTEVLFATVDDIRSTLVTHVARHRRDRVLSFEPDRSGATTSCRLTHVAMSPCGHWVGVENTPYMYLAIFHAPVSDGGERKALTLTPRHGYARATLDGTA